MKVDMTWCILFSGILSALLLPHSSEAASEKKSETTKPKVLLMSVPGLGGHYLNTINLTNIAEFIAKGAKAKYVENSVNVLELVNHYSIVTGLYPESHGIVADTMYDPQLKRVFDSKTRAQAEWWLDVHPIWQEIERQGQGLSALCRWPGVYGPMIPTLQCSDEEGKSLKDDIDQAIRWLKNDVKLVLLYSDEIKKAALRWGPHSQQAMNEVRKFDSTLKYLLNQTRDLNVNILLTSDSGVTDLNWRHVVDLDQCIHPKSYVLVQPQATLLFYPRRGHTVEEVYLKLSKCEHLRVYLKQDLPKRFHFSSHRRIPPIVAFVPLGALVRSSKRPHRKVNEILILGKPWDHMGGTGYHPGYEEMRGVFIGYGPSFQLGLKFHAIRNVDIYPLLCHLLGATPRPNNGSRDSLVPMLNDMTSFAADVNTTESSTRQAMIHRIEVDSDVRVLFWILVAMTALLMLFCCVGCFTTMHDNYKRGHASRTKVVAPAEKKLLTANSSDDEE